MSRLNPMGIGLTLAITAGLLYLLCALVVAVFPGALSAVFSLVVHDFNVAPLAEQVAPMSLAKVLFGWLAITGYGFVAGLLFAVVNNLLAQRLSR